MLVRVKGVEAMALTEKRTPDMIEFLFPDGKDKAVTFSYDDAQIYDRRLVSIFDQYGMKGTFHLNSGTLGEREYITKDEVGTLYGNHEVACHAVTHPFFNELSQGMMVRELLEDRHALEGYTNRIVRGFSYPFGEYSDRLMETARQLGIVYARTVEDRMNFNLPGDFMCWHPTCHHNKVTDAMIEDFLNPPMYRNLALFYIWGHSFEFERENNWNHIRHICEALQGREDVWYATNIEIYEYVTAIRSLVMSADGRIIYNPTATPVYLMIGYTKACVPAGMSLTLCGEKQS